MADNDQAPARGSRVQLKTPKGTRDGVGDNIRLRDHILHVLHVDPVLTLLY